MREIKPTRGSAFGCRTLWDCLVNNITLCPCLTQGGCAGAGMLGSHALRCQGPGGWGS